MNSKLFLIVIILVLIISCAKTEVKKEVKKEFISESLIELDNKFNKKGLTNLQKEKLAEQYEGKYANWIGYVENVDIEFDGYTLVFDAQPIGTISGEIHIALIKMKDSEKDKLLTLNRGDKIKIQARLRKYLGGDDFDLDDGFINSIVSKDLENCLKQHVYGCTTDSDCINKSYYYCEKLLKDTCKFGPTEITCT